MENKKYLDKVIGSLVRGTKINYINKRFSFPFFLSSSVPFPFVLSCSSSPIPFSTHCKNIYGLTEKEIEYVWKEYKDIILNKIKNGE